MQARLTIEPGASATQDLVLAEAHGVIAGTVRDATGAPLAGVQVEAGEHLSSEGMTLGMGSHTTYSDAQGRYRLDGLAVAHYQVEVSAESRAGLVARPRSHALDLGPEQSVDELDFVLVPAIIVAGWIDPGTTPLAELEVSLRRADGEECEHRSPDVDGRFSIDGLDPQPYELVLLHAGEELTRVPVSASGAENLVLVAPR